MKIGFLNNAYYPTKFGGSERSVQMLAESVERQGHKGTVLTISPSEKYEERQVNGVHVTYLPERNVRWSNNRRRNPLRRVLWHIVDSYNPWAAADVTRWLEKEKPEIVHTNILGGFSVAVWDAVRKFGVPIVHTLREYYLQCRLMSLNRGGVNCEGHCAFCQVCAIPRRARSPLPQAVVGVSRHVLESHLEAGFFSGVPIREVIFNPFLIDSLTLKPEAPKKLLRLGFFGRMESLKGIDFLLKEIQTLPRDKYELYVGGAGDTRFTRMLRRNQVDLGMPVHWLGFMEPADFFSKIDLLVVPSIWQEPFGRVIVEAYSCGIPVLASRAGGMPEIVDEGVTGFLFDLSTPGSFQAKLGGITRATLDAMRKACLQKSREFEPDLIGRQYLDLFNRVLRQQSSR